MLYDKTWMNRDERTPEQREADRKRHLLWRLQGEEKDLVQRLEHTRKEIAAITAGQR